MQKSPVNSNHHLVLFSPYIGPLSGATSLAQSGPGSDGNEGVLRIPQSSSITGTSLEGVLPLCREAVGVFYSRSRLGPIYRHISSSTRCDENELKLSF